MEIPISANCPFAYRFSSYKMLKLLFSAKKAVPLHSKTIACAPQQLIVHR